MRKSMAIAAVSCGLCLAAPPALADQSAVSQLDASFRAMAAQVAFRAVMTSGRERTTVVQTGVGQSVVDTYAGQLRRSLIETWPLGRAYTPDAVYVEDPAFGSCYRHLIDEGTAWRADVEPFSLLSTTSEAVASQAPDIATASAKRRGRSVTISVRRDLPAGHASGTLTLNAATLLPLTVDTSVSSSGIEARRDTTFSYRPTVPVSAPTAAQMCASGS